LHLARPAIEGEEVNGGEGIGGVDGYGDDGEEPEPAVGENGDAGTRSEVGEGLEIVSVNVCITERETEPARQR